MVQNKDLNFFLLQKVERDIKNHVKLCAGHKEKIKG